MFLHRDKELDLLNKSYYQPTSSLDFIFGKRNSGKTTLLNEFTKDKDRLYLASYEMISHHFFTSIANVINNHFENKEVKLTFNSFSDVLEFLNNQDIKQKLIIIFDNFQNILNMDKNALTILLSFWKSSLKYKNIQLIVSSSVLFDEKNTQIIDKLAFCTLNLKYLDFTSLREFFPSMKKLDQLYVYSLLGTTTTNLKYYNSQKNFSENIYNLFLSPNAYMFDYGMKILKYDISDIGTYASILHSISQGNTKIGDIATSLNIKSTYLSRYMQKLVDLMIIKKIVPIGDEIKKSKYGRYEIEDNALNFWFLYIFPNLSKLQFMNVDTVTKLIEEEFINKIVFNGYKKCIKEYIFNNQIEIFGYEPKYIGSWWDNIDVIDLVAYDTKTITFIKILWEEKNISSHTYDNLKNISSKFNSTLERKYIIISKNTFFNII